MIRGVLLDLSGVLYEGNRPLAGAHEALARLKAVHVPVRFITNTTRKPRHAVHAQLTAMAFDVAQEDIFTAPLAAVEYCRAQDLQPYLIVHPALESEVAALGSGPFNAVLVGDAAQAFTYDRLNCAFRLLKDGAPLLAMGMNRYFREPDGLSLDAGPFVKALEYAAHTNATVLGKPAPAFFHTAAEALGCAPGAVAMVGDDVESDVIGAVEADLQGVLVKTGKYRDGDERRIRQPGAAIAADIGAAVDWILDHN
jgi:HAD superfamily hydrolase (TIGR01458 family)